jgi:hypothetical protein
MIVAVVILAVVAVLLVGLMLWVRRAVSRSRRTLDSALAGRPVVTAENALSLGVASRGKRQLRGSGTLALCHDRVLFVQWVPSSVLEIPFADITHVDTTKVHLGKSVGAPLLRISWMTPDGGDQIALQVRDVDRWLGVLPAGGAGASTGTA